MTQGCFVTGTDTGCGKTLVALALLHRLRQLGQSVCGMKPVAAGAHRAGGQLRNDDAERLRAASDGAPDYRDVNPYVFEPAIAPHIAAARVGVRLDIAPVLAARDRLAAEVDWLVVEGAGGWRVPLGPGQRIGDWATALQYPVIMVVGLRLGCLNHALLTADAIVADGAYLAGWVANGIDPAMAESDDNINTLINELDAPLIARIGHQSAIDPRVAACAFDRWPALVER